MSNEELKVLAEAATAGPWIAAGPSFGSDQPKYLEEVLVDREGDEDDTYTVCQAPDGLRAESSADMAFIAAANPAVVLALLTENERLLMIEKSFQLQPLLDVLGERDQLKAENAGLKTGYEAYEQVVQGLKAEVAKWKGESMGDSETIYRLSCDLAQRTGEVRELAGVVDDFTAMTKRFVQRLRKAAPGNDLPEQALDYLKRKELLGSPMRDRIGGANHG